MIAVKTDLFTELVTHQDLQPPCDFRQEGKSLCQDEPAKWVLFRVPCCEAKANAALACDACKEARMLDLMALECEFCGHIFEHAPDAYYLIEPIGHPHLPRGRR